MYRKLTLSLILTVCIFLAGKFSFAANITINGASNTNYTLGAGDTLFIGASGNYTGTISGLNGNNRVIVVANGGIFNPLALNPNNGIVCKMHVYGTFTYTSALTTNTDFTLDVYAGGVVSLGAMNTKGKNQLWTNHLGGTLSFSGDVLVNGGTIDDDNNVFINYGTLSGTGDFQMNSGSKLYNYKDFTLGGNFRVNGGTYESQGNLIVTGSITMNNGASIIRNYCRMEASGGINNTSGNFYNYSYVRAVNSDITNSANIINASVSVAGSPLSRPIIEGRNYTHTSGTMTGPAQLYFTGTTTISGGTIGVLGATTDTIKMYDITRTSPSTIFDNQAANTVRPNVIYNAWGVPDPSLTYLFGCSLEIFLEIPLAINWNDFTVNLFDNIPVLNWSAEFGSGTIFEIQRSYDGRNFSTIRSMAYEVGETGYEYKDRSVNTQKQIVYYRIKSNEVSGVEKYTHIRTVKFSNKPGSIHAAPNPFTNNFIITYNAAENEMITIKLFNVSGQQMLSKNTTVNTGDNRINISEAAQLTRGIYVIQVSKGSNIVSSSKIIKQ